MVVPRRAGFECVKPVVASGDLMSGVGEVKQVLSVAAVWPDRPLQLVPSHVRVAISGDMGYTLGDFESR
jgi:hypothetical protein